MRCVWKRFMTVLPFPGVNPLSASMPRQRSSQARKKKHNLDLWIQKFSGAVAVFHAKGGMSQSASPRSKLRANRLFGSWIARTSQNLVCAQDACVPNQYVCVCIHCSALQRQTSSEHVGLVTACFAVSHELVLQLLLRLQRAIAAVPVGR